MALFLIINVPLYIGYGPSWIFNSTIYINMFLCNILQIIIQYLQLDFFKSD